MRKIDFWLTTVCPDRVLDPARSAIHCSYSNSLKLWGSTYIYIHVALKPLLITIYKRERNGWLKAVYAEEIVINF